MSFRSKHAQNCREWQMRRTVTETDNEEMWVSNDSIVQSRHSFLRCKYADSSFLDVNTNCADHEYRSKTATRSDASLFIRQANLPKCQRCRHTKQWNVFE